MYSRSSVRTWCLRAILAATALAGLGACAGDNGGPVIPHVGADAAGVETLQRIYRLRVGDKLKISVFGEDNLSGDFEVNALGVMPLPLIGEVKALGLPIRALRDAIKEKLKDGYLNDPRVTVEVLNFRPFFVHGEVRSGGELTFKNGLRLRDAIAMAGGYTYRANRGYALIIREGLSAEVKVLLPTDLPVMPGDNIRIPERFF